jgi:hypothetical protein
MSCLNPPHPWCAARHGEGEKLAGQLQSLRAESRSHGRTVPAEVAAKYSQQALLPKLVTLVEGKNS